MTSSSTSSGSPRYSELDGLRGLAAFSVLLLHATLTLPSGAVVAVLRTPPLSVFSDGLAAVDLFFVLSGFVLALPFVGPSDRPIGYTSFVIRRAFRILPAYWLSIVVALALRYTLFEADGLETLGPWSRGIWQTPPGHWVDHLILVGPWSTSKLINPVFGPQRIYDVNPVIWTLVVEMRMSLIFPLAILLIRRANDVRSVALLILLSFTIVVLLPVLWALPLFMLGGLLAHHRHAVRRWRRCMSPAWLAGLWLLAFVLYDFRYTIGGFHHVFVVTHYVSGIGAALILLLVVQGSAVRFLTSPPVRFLGRISYGVYLFHLPILIKVLSQSTKLMATPLGAWALASATSLVLTIAISALAYRLLEQPAQRLGRSLSARMSGSGRTSSAGRLAPAAPRKPPEGRSLGEST